MAKTALVETKPLGQLVVTGDIESALPLEHIAVTGQITGMLVSVAVAQRFGNPLNEPVELDYLFPLPHEAAVVDFELRLGMRSIRAEVKELEQARTAYEEAQRQGKRSGLLEQRRPNLFAVHLSNVQPGETILSMLRYQQRLSYDSGTFEFVYPMGITPKYDSPAHPEEGAGVQAPIAAAGEAVGTIEINLAVDAGLEVFDPASPSHPIEVDRLDERRFQVRLAGAHIPDHDFVLRYNPVDAQAALTAWASADKGGETFLACVLPPVMEKAPEPAPRQFVFVLDRSGSMSGEPIAQARNALRACLRSLNPDDTFLILLFDDQLQWYRPEPTPVTQAAIDLADSFLSQVDGRGGTEIVQAIEAALDVRQDPGRTRLVVFLTDGAVSAEDRALEQVRRKLGSARLFTFGIGPSVNRALLSSLAHSGRGACEFLQPNEDIEGTIIRFQDRVSFPALTNLSLEWQGAHVWDVYPSRLPDLYIGQPLEICGRLTRKDGPSARLTLRGQRGAEAVTLSLEIPAASGVEPAVGRAWARARVDDLLEAEALGSQPAHLGRGEIIGLALAYRLVTKYTAFVAVDQETAKKHGSGKVIHVAQPLPQGLEMDAFLPQASHLRLASAGKVYNAMMMPPAPLPAASDGQFHQKQINSENLDIPAFSRQRLSKTPGSQSPTVPLPDRQSLLRQLARSQRLDGSWDGDVETTAAALLAFVRAGHTTRRGTFRQAVARAFQWLEQSPASQFAAFARALALEELAQATGLVSHQAAAQAARQTLPAPASELEMAALAALQPPVSPSPSGPARTPSQLGEIAALDDLRLAGVLQASLPVPAKLLQGKSAGLAAAWAAALPEVE